MSSCHYPFRLLSEEFHMKIYGDPQMSWNSAKTPFLGHINEDPVLMEHFNGYHLGHMVELRGDYLESHEHHRPMDDIQGSESDHDHDIGGAEAEHNLDNLLEN